MRIKVWNKLVILSKIIKFVSFLKKDFAIKETNVNMHI